MTQTHTKQLVPDTLRGHLAKTGGKLERALLVDRAAVDESARTATLAFASETPYERWWGIEVLNIAPQSMRQGRLRSGANLLCDHDVRDVVGVVESVEIGADRVARATVRFGKSARAEEVWQDVLGGIRRNVSFGYMIHEAVLESTKDGVETYRVTDFEPYEVSLVSVPADASVGVGRSLETQSTEQKGVCVTVEIEVETEAGEEPEDDPAAEPVAVLPSTDESRQQINKPKPKETIMTEPVQVVEQRNHAAEITKIAATIPGGADLAMKSIQAGHTTEEFQKEAIRHMSSLPVPNADIGMNTKETKQYSVLRALNALTNPTDTAAQRAAAFERECSDEYAKKSGKAAQGLFVPPEVQRRDLNVGTPTAGGNTVATNLLAGSFIELLRNAMVIDKMGAIYLPGLVGNIAIPKQTGSATAYWVIEGAAPTESQQTIGQVSMSPKTIGAYTDFTRRMFLQSSIEVEQFVMNDLAKTVGLGIQQDVFTGPNTTGRLNGLLNQVTPSVVGGTNGLAPTWDHIVDLETNVSVANADIGTLGYLTNAKVRGKLKKSFVNGTGGTERVWQNGAEPLNGYRTAVTNAMPSNLTKGTGANLSAIAFGNFADLVIGLWSGLDLMVDPYAGSTSGTVRVIALQDVDMALRNVESFATMVDAITG
jgi:HK97 family phage major capsid protein/HK97 family phage prohead protease